MYFIEKTYKVYKIIIKNTNLIKYKIIKWDWVQ